MNRFLALNTLLNHKCINKNLHKVIIYKNMNQLIFVLKTSCIFLTQNLGISFTVLSSISDELQRVQPWHCCRFLRNSMWWQWLHPHSFHPAHSLCTSVVYKWSHLVDSLFFLHPLGYVSRWLLPYVLFSLKLSYWSV